MLTKLNGSESMGIPMLFPLTWEENVAAAMTKIPIFEFFPGVLVSNLYKAYRQGLSLGVYGPVSGSIFSDQVVGYISDSTGKNAAIVADFLNALVLTVNGGLAPKSVLTGTAESGIIEKAGSSISTTIKPINNTLKYLSIGIIGIASIYALSIARPFFSVIGKDKK